LKKEKVNFILFQVSESSTLLLKLLKQSSRKRILREKSRFHWFKFHRRRQKTITPAKARKSDNSKEALANQERTNSYFALWRRLTEPEKERIK